MTLQNFFFNRKHGRETGKTIYKWEIEKENKCKSCKSKLIGEKNLLLSGLVSWRLLFFNFKHLNLEMDTKKTIKRTSRKREI